jgi:hypothetical protein
MGPVLSLQIEWNQFQDFLIALQNQRIHPNQTRIQGTMESVWIVLNLISAQNLRFTFMDFLMPDSPINSLLQIIMPFEFFRVFFSYFQESDH